MPDVADVTGPEPGERQPVPPGGGDRAWVDHVSDVRHDGDLLITVCDLAHEELGSLAPLHWSVPDPVPAGDLASFDTALAELSHRIGLLAPRLAAHPAVLPW